MRLRYAAIALASVVAACANAAGNPPPPFPALRQADIAVKTRSGSHQFEVWIADDDESREQGLMHVRKLPPERGMLFLFDRPQVVAFWMKDTHLSLDLIFIGANGAVANVAENAKPLSLDPIESHGPVSAVLEVTAGTANRIGLEPGDRIALPALRTTSVPSKRFPASPDSRSPN